MIADLFAPPVTLLSGAIAGFLFGFLLQKGGVTRYETIVGQFLLRDFTVLKTMVTAIAVGGVGIYAMRAAGVEFAMHVKGAVLLANALGGVVFGLGMALLGYCPGTAVGAIAEGSRHAAVGVAGMIAGALAYAEVHPWFAEHVLKPVDYGKVTIPELIGVSGWWVWALAAVAAGVWFAVSRRPVSAHGG